MIDLRIPQDPQRQAEIRRMLVAQATPALAMTRSRQLALAGALAATVAATGAAVLAVYPDPPAANYAGWTAEPQGAPPLTAPDKEMQEWASKCSDLGVGGVAVQGVPAHRDAAARREVLVDRRGGFTYCVDVAIGSGTASNPTIALSGLKADGRNGLNAMEATVYDKALTPPRDASVLMLGGDTTDTQPPDDGTEQIKAFQMYGLSGPAITGIDLVLTNGLRITATLRNGIWGLWWPSDRGDPAGCKLQLHAAAGLTTVDPETVRLQIR